MGSIGNSNDIIDFSNDVAFAQIHYADQSMPAFRPDPSAEAGLMQPLQYSEEVSAQAATAPSVVVSGDLPTEEIAALRGLNNRYNHNRHLDFNYLIIEAFDFDYII